MRRGIAACLVLLGCTAASGGDDTGLDADVDANVDAASDASVVDAAHGDAGATRWLRDPHLACGERSYDLADPTTYDTPEELIFALADARCAEQIRCAIPTAACAPWSVEPPTHLRAPVDVTQARACLSDLDTISCDTYFPRSCDALVAEAGYAPIGEHCGRGSACSPGRCTDGVTGSCAGTCVTRGCPPCGAGEYCPAGASVCEPRPGEGDFCEGDACADGLACDPFRAVCIRAPLAGEPCGTFYSPYTGVATEWCGAGLVCDAHACVVPTLAAVGEACGGRTICGADAACEGGACVAFPGPGQPCSTSSPTCAGDLICNARGLCGILVGPGCPCGDATTCPFGTWCDLGRCTSILEAVPMHCDSFLDCGGLPCVDGACVVGTDGAACTNDGDCPLGHCSPVDGTCVPDVPLGSDCTHDARCVRGTTCLHGACAPQGTACYVAGT